MRAEAFQKECKNVAHEVIKKGMLSKGWKGEIPQEIVDVFKDKLVSLFESYFFEKRLYEALLKKQHETREMATALEIDFRMLPAETRIDTLIARNHEGLLMIEACLHRVIGTDSEYFIQQVKMSKHQLRQMDKRVKEEVRMFLGNKLDDLLSLRK